MSKGDAPDTRGLIREAYHIAGITEAECRSIFLDWALAVDEEIEASIDVLLARHGEVHPQHPMTKVLRQGLTPPDAAPRRRGGWRRHKR